MAVSLYRILDKNEKQQQLESLMDTTFFYVQSFYHCWFFCIKKWEVEKEWALHNYDYNRTTTIFFASKAYLDSLVVIL